jgi:hypothetical protein
MSTFKPVPSELLSQDNKPFLYPIFSSSRQSDLARNGVGVRVRGLAKARLSLRFSAYLSRFEFTKTIWTKDNVDILGIHHGFRELAQLCFINNNGQHRYKYHVQGRDKSYFVKQRSDSTKTFSETDIIKMLEFLIDNIFVMFGGRVFRPIVGIPMDANCALFIDLFLYSYEADFIQGLLEKNEKKLARSFKFTFRYIDEVNSLTNSRFGDFVDRIYPKSLK